MKLPLIRVAFLSGIACLLPQQLDAKSTQSDVLSVVMTRDGTVHLPAMTVPYSNLVSPATRKGFIESMRLQGVIDRKPHDSTGSVPDIHTLRSQVDARAQDALLVLRRRFSVSITSGQLNGVKVHYVIHTSAGQPVKSDRVLISLHGGDMIVGAGNGELVQAIPIAATSGIEIVSVDYRMAPEAHFPAASEDVVKVYSALLKKYSANRIGLFGCSSGASLTAQTTAMLDTLKLPLPGAIGVFGQGAVSDNNFEFGDSNYAAAPLGGYGVRPVRPGYIPANWDYFRSVNAYAPLVSPLFHPEILRRFPPTLLLSGTRDVGLSTVVRTHSELVAQGVDAELHVWEAMPHCSYAEGLNVPETEQAWRVIAHFFLTHLGHQ